MFSNALQLSGAYMTLILGLGVGRFLIIKPTKFNGFLKNFIRFSNMTGRLAKANGKSNDDIQKALQVGYFVIGIVYLTLGYVVPTLGGDDLWIPWFNDKDLLKYIVRLIIFVVLFISLLLLGIFSAKKIGEKILSK